MQDQTAQDIDTPDRDAAYTRLDLANTGLIEAITSPAGVDCTLLAEWNTAFGACIDLERRRAGVGKGQP